ncbi:MAG TPA: galactokinase [Anaerolineae bacterium]|nr:galactokinase [Anaerolineae bacterium]
MEPLRKIVGNAFYDRFGESPQFFVRAPGRVNLIGEHTDYNDGFVLPIAIDREIWIALRPRKDRRVLLTSMDYKELAEFTFNDLRHGSGWTEYVKGIAWILQKHEYRLNGWEGILGSNVPVGGGLSSSAALEMALSRAFYVVSDWRWDGKIMAQLAREADHQWVGIKSGIMDQLISAEGRVGHALLIDCRTLALESVPLPDTTRVVILDTATRRGLVDSIYNQRVAECKQAADFFGVQALRDVRMEQIESRPHALPEDVYRRARHVVTENARTLQAANALRRGDVVQFGKLMDASHVSLREDYQVSSGELDLMVSIARERKGCYGARMTGAGFGGCVVALVEKDEVEPFVENVSIEYYKESRLKPKVYITEAVKGASVE